MPVSTSPNWTGFYAGGELGYANVKGKVSGFGSDDEGGLIGGLVAGYDYDLGDWVVGAGLDYDWTDVSFSDPGYSLKADSIWRVKVRGGYKIGNGLLYATAGYAQMKIKETLGGASYSGSDDGYFVGAGYDHMVTDNMAIGGELLYHDFDNFKSSGVDFEAVTAQVRATFRF